MKNKIARCYMLDTNMVSHFIRGEASVCNKVVSIPMSELAISAITEGELLFGLAKNVHAKQLHLMIREFLIRVDSLLWDSDAANCYGKLRALMQKKGKVLGNLDMLIAAHALAVGAILVTNERAFRQVDGLILEDWFE